MWAVVLTALFIVSVSAQFGKHVYVNQQLTWSLAQEHCRKHYTDLSPIMSQQEEKTLRNRTLGKVKEFWIGLYRNGTEWWWSGGGLATYTPWDEEEPDAWWSQTVVSVCWDGCEWNGWHNIPYTTELPFFCLNLISVGKERTWENAARYCKRHHNVLTSLTSETVHLLAQRAIQRANITERVWIGLRFLQDRWLWINGDPLEYQAWPQGGDQDHQCPLLKRCGTLTKAGRWENWDCKDKLNFICI